MRWRVVRKTEQGRCGVREGWKKSVRRKSKDSGRGWWGGGGKEEGRE